MVAGNSNKEVAGLLGLSPRTVEFHRAHILAKTGAGLARACSPRADGKSGRLIPRSFTNS